MPEQNLKKDISLMVSIILNPTQTGVFCCYVGLGGEGAGHNVSPFGSPFICCAITTKLGMVVLWHNISQKQ